MCLSLKLNGICSIFFKRRFNGLNVKSGEKWEICYSWCVCVKFEVVVF